MAQLTTLSLAALVSASVAAEPPSSGKHAGTDIESLASRGELVLRVHPQHRWNTESGIGAWGFGVDAKLQVRAPGKAVFWGGGIAYGTVSLPDAMDGMRLDHSYLALEVLLGTRVQLNASTRLEVSAGLLPSLYVSSVSGPNGEPIGEAQGFVLGHLRATMGISIGNFYLGTGVHHIGNSSFWFEPISVGLHY